ncbi:MAG: hypothetical protein M1825_003470 [Sarcosagium campestre]|nr:MAG: hypothetical protein M1825_003470 [Sarcosagium campestre]
MGNRQTLRPPLTSDEVDKRDRYRQWKRMLRVLPDHGTIRDKQIFWRDALELLSSGEKDSQQKLARDLVNDDMPGLHHVRAVMSIRPGDVGDTSFIQVVRPFLAVITHSALLDCLSIDSEAGDLFNFVSGSSGDRAIPFFRVVVTILKKVSLSSADLGEEVLEKMLLTVSIALREVLRRSHKSQTHEDLLDLLDLLGENLTILNVDFTSVAVQTAMSCMAEMQRIAKRAQDALAGGLETGQKDGLVATRLITSTYPRDIEFPGGRHDNDKRDITNICILPTEDEIRSERLEFLPSTEAGQPHFLRGVERLLDTHFRLLRHDIFAELKSVPDGAALTATTTHLLGDMHAFAYENASVTYLSFTVHRSLEAQISFLQPKQTRKGSTAERRRWWEDSKRLEEGSLMCLLNRETQEDSLLFFTVSQKITDSGRDYGLASNGSYATITAKLAAVPGVAQVRALINLHLTRPSHGILIEFPGILLATFIPTLENIKEMQKSSRLPFERWIIPDTVEPMPNTPLPTPLPPLYARAPGFTYDLKPILKRTGSNLDFSPSHEDAEMARNLQQSTHLDLGQCEALQTALKQEFALIQGPPGTGKSYLGVQLMRVLVANKQKGNLGPILVVCYTNHALDQFLEHLLKDGIDKVIRIGGQSTSTLLEGKNLRLASRHEDKTGGERFDIGQCYGRMGTHEGKISMSLGKLRGLRKLNWQSFRHTIMQSHPRIYDQFSRTDAEGFTLAAKTEPFERWRAARDVDPKTLLDPIGDLQRILWQANKDCSRLALEDRQLLVDHWKKVIEEDLIQIICDELEEDARSRRQKDVIHDEVDRRVLETADVIGVTTSGLAKRITVLRRVRAKVVMCEEAGEVLEAHMLSTLIPSIEHLIQIGDHQQLRPQINSYDLSLESPQGQLYQLDRSQFERLSNRTPGMPPFPVAQLNVQRRMRPQISSLIRNTLYERLIDHESTQEFNNVAGMKKNVSWLNHANMEDNARSDSSQRSKSNTWEVSMTYALVRHIVRQGVYDSKDIAVLTPYVGQLQKLRAVMREKFEIVVSERDQEALYTAGLEDDSSPQTDSSRASHHKLEKKQFTDLLRVATVDNFQGEEAKIVIISLVRSNNQRNVGFLKTTNRINVLLSRAQHGMYLIGNADTYSKVPMWSEVLVMLRIEDCVGEAFSLCCPRHTETEILVSEPDDFLKLSPEGGCRLIYGLTPAVIDA